MDNDYTFNLASTEIIIAMIAAFILGALLCYLLRLLGLCCRRRPEKIAAEPATGNTDTVTAELADNQLNVPIPPAPTMAVAAKEIPTASTVSGSAASHNNRLSVEGGAYEADIDSLLRGSGARDPGSVALPENANTNGNSSFENRVRESLTSSPGSPSADIASLDFPDDDHVDDLKKLEGIGPRIEKLLNDAGIKSYARLATMERDRLRDILQAGGREFTMHEPKSWPYQAELAAKQNWNRLREYQEFLLEGRGT